MDYYIFVDLQLMKKPAHPSFLTIFYFLFILSIIHSEHLQAVSIKDDVPSHESRLKLHENKISKNIDEPHKSLSGKTEVKGQVYRFEDTNLSSNLLITSKYALIGQNNQPQPIIKKLNFATMKLQTIKYPPVEDWWSIYPTTFVDLQNGDIAFAEGFHLFILDNQTLEIKQTFTNYEPIDPLAFLLTYINPKTKESKYIFGRGMNSIMMSEYKKNDTGKYDWKYRFISPYALNGLNIILTGTNSAVSLGSYFCEISYWTNLNSIMNLSYDHKYYMKNRIKVAVSYDETFFIARNQSGFYEFYTFDDKYETRNKSSIFISYNEHRKGMMSSDDKYLFVSMSNSRNKHDIAKIDVEASEFTFVIDEYGNSDNQIDFNLFDAESNRFVTLSVRNTTNYFLQLRAVDSLKLIHEYQLKFNFTALEYKFVGNTEWGLTFALAVRTNPSYYDLQNDSKLFLYSVEGDKIVSANIAAPSVTFSTLQACYTYIISYKARFPTIKVYHYSNLSLATQIKSLSQNEYGFNVERNLFILSYDSHVVFDLKQSFSNKGWFYKSNSGSNDPIYSQIFPKRGLLYDSPINTRYDFEVMKKVYNISTLPVTSRLTLESEYGCNSQTYYIPPEDNQPGRNYFLYIEFDHPVYTKHPQLARYSESSKTTQKYPIEAFPEEVHANIKVSTDKKYILILVCEWATQNCLIEIRPFASLQKATYREFRTFDRQKYRYQNQINIDLADGKMLFIQAPYFLQARMIDLNSKIDNSLSPTDKKQTVVVGVSQ